jgi:hypothetical protein
VVSSQKSEADFSEQHSSLLHEPPVILLAQRIEVRKARTSHESLAFGSVQNRQQHGGQDGDDGDDGDDGEKFDQCEGLTGPSRRVVSAGLMKVLSRALK